VATMQAVRAQLEMQIEEILAQPAPVPPPTPPAEPSGRPRLGLSFGSEPDEREPFGRWLLAQTDRGDWIDELAAAARGDRRFPRNGNPDDVRKHLNAMGAEGDMFERVDDAEAAWRSC
jgi:hypothetical protein